MRNQHRRIETLESRSGENVTLFIVRNTEHETDDDAIKRRYPEQVPPHSEIVFIHTNVTRRLN
jgi:hypothetical protein